MTEVVRPNCDCHGRPMNKNESRWRCAVEQRDQNRIWRKVNADKVQRANSRRLWMGGYAGMFGFTRAQIRGIVNGSSD